MYVIHSITQLLNFRFKFGMPVGILFLIFNLYLRALALERGNCWAAKNNNRCNMNMQIAAGGYDRTLHSSSFNF